MQELIKEVWPNWTGSWFLDHKCITPSIFNIYKWLLLLRVLIIIHNNLYSHGKSYCARNFLKIEKGFQVILVLEELGFWTSKGYILFIFWDFWVIKNVCLSLKGYQLITSWVYFHAFLNKASLRFKLHHWVCFKVISWQSLLWFIMPQFFKGNKKIQKLIKEVWPNWTSSWSQVHNFINS